MNTDNENCRNRAIPQKMPILKFIAGELHFQRSLAIFGISGNFSIHVYSCKGFVIFSEILATP
jgi:hypothetical protein